MVNSEIVIRPEPLQVGRRTSASGQVKRETSVYPPKRAINGSSETATADQLDLRGLSSSGGRRARLPNFAQMQ